MKITVKCSGCEETWKENFFYWLIEAAISWTLRPFKCMFCQIREKKENNAGIIHYGNKGR